MTGNKNIVVAIYFHPEAYPPTLNALGELSKLAAGISVLHRPHLTSVWPYPANVKLHASGQAVTARQQEISSVIKKVRYFLKFTLMLRRLIKKEKPALVLVYDNLSLFAFALIRPFISRKIKCWYHNHDVVEPGSQRKYSLGWWSLRAERKAFNWLHIFSLPADERKAWFPLDTFKGSYFFIPNLPSLAFYGRLQPQPQPGGVIRLIYQGRISRGHGLEEIIPLLQTTVHGKKLDLHIAGGVTDAYKNELESLAASHGVTDRLHFTGFIPYRELPAFTAGCHIGIAINRPEGIIYQTGGTASNKIYEYMACGLPVLYFNTPHYNEWLGAYPWAFGTDLTPESITSCITAIDGDYAALSKAALSSFTSRLNFETCFAPAAAGLHQIL